MSPAAAAAAATHHHQYQFLLNHHYEPQRARYQLHPHHYMHPSLRAPTSGSMYLCIYVESHCLRPAGPKYINELVCVLGTFLPVLGLFLIIQSIIFYLPNPRLGQNNVFQIRAGKKIIT
jgi:hypothetical protein